MAFINSDPAPAFARYLNIRSATAPALSEDGARVAFLSDITGTAQVWSVGLASDPDARWPRQLTHFADKVWELHGAPRGDRLIAVGDVAGNERQQFYLLDGFGLDRTGHDHHRVRRLTTDDAAIHRFGAWNGAGNAFLYSSNVRTQIDFDLYVGRLVENGERCEHRLVAELSGNCYPLAFAPDDSSALVASAPATGRIELMLIRLDGTDLSGNGTPVVHRLTADMPDARYSAVAWRQTGLFVLTDREHDRGAFCRLDPQTAALQVIVTADDLLAHLGERSGELDGLAVTRAGRRAALALNVEGYSRLFLVDCYDGRVRPLNSLSRGVVANLAFVQADTRLLLDYQSPCRNPDIWLVDVAADEATQVTFSNRAGLDAATFVAPDLVHFDTFDSRAIPAFLYRPAVPPPPAGFPCILYVHGGPASQQRPDFDVRFQYFLQRGYAILVPNVRGSTGYGRHYMGLDDVERRMDSVADLKFAVDWAAGQPEIDERRMVIYGRSYGGFMVLAALTEYPDLFAAGIDVVGIADWETFLARTSVWRRAHREAEYGSLAEHRELLRRISPLHRAERIAVPLLVVAGDNDPRVPLYESEQIVERVRAAGGTVVFVHYADEGHRISKLANRIDSFTRMADFLERHLGPPQI